MTAVSQSRSPLPSPPERLEDLNRWALFLDLDGCLCELVDDPAEVRLDAPTTDLLRRLQAALNDAVCILSGRTQADLDRILASLEIERIGEHGAQHALPEEGSEAARQLAYARERLGELLPANPGVWLEAKGASCALHYRQAPNLANRLIPAVSAIAASLPGLRLLHGRCVLELSTADHSKGTALRQRMQEPRYVERLPIAVGDDSTDEDAFRAARGLGGFAVAVGPRLSAAAQFHLDDPAALRTWLNGLLRGAEA